MSTKIKFTNNGTLLFCKLSTDNKQWEVGCDIKEYMKDPDSLRRVLNNMTICLLKEYRNNFYEKEKTSTSKKITA